MNEQEETLKLWFEEKLTKGIGLSAMVNEAKTLAHHSKAQLGDNAPTIEARLDFIIHNATLLRSSSLDTRGLTPQEQEVVLAALVDIGFAALVVAGSLDYTAEDVVREWDKNYREAEQSVKAGTATHTFFKSRVKTDPVAKVKGATKPLQTRLGRRKITT